KRRGEDEKSRSKIRNQQSKFPLFTPFLCVEGFGFEMTIINNRETRTHALRCVHCGAVQGETNALFRCSKCGELLEVIYPRWDRALPDALQLKKIWQERKLSPWAEDLSGVWRYRELLPDVEPHNIVTLREGNTPLLMLYETSRKLNDIVVLAKHLGMNP